MGGLFGGNKKTTSTNQTSTTAPWAPQQPYIMQGWQQAQSALNTNMQNGPYQGQLYAPITPGQIAGAAQQTAFGTGPGSALANAGATGLGTLFGNAGTFTNNAAALAANGVAGPNSGLWGTLSGYGTGSLTPSLVSAPLSGALQSAALTGASNLTNLAGNYSTIANTALSNPTNTVLANAKTYENSAPVQQALDSTNQAIQQNLDLGLAQNNAQEAATGNLDSSRAGMEQGLERQSAALATGQADSSILNNAFNTGLGTATGLYENGLSTALNATNSGAANGLSSALDTANLQNNMGQFATNTQIGAATSGLGQQQGFEGLNANTMLNANSQLGQGIFDAALGANNVMNAGATAGQLAQASGYQQQQNQQAIDNAGYQQFTNTTNFPWTQLGPYMQIVSNPTFTTTNSQGTTTQQTQGNTLGGLMGLAALAAAPFTGGSSLLGIAPMGGAGAIGSSLLGNALSGTMLGNALSGSLLGNSLGVMGTGAVDTFGGPGGPIFGA